MDLPEIKEKVLKALRDFPIEVAYIFGSATGGHRRSDSDLDVAVMLQERLSPEERFKQRLLLSTAIERSLGVRTDVVILNDTGSVELKYNIINTGRLLFCAPNFSHAEFESRATTEYFDFKPFIDAYNKAYVERNT